MSYNGYFRADGKTKVVKNNVLLDIKESLEYVNHSSMYFGWGLKTNAALQLAFAILLEEYGVDFAKRNYKNFMENVIAKFDCNSQFKLTMKEIEYWKKKANVN